jgi:hypothetical protein
MALCNGKTYALGCVTTEGSEMPGRYPPLLLPCVNL